uniref:Uncharacterized protein n=1 Tax=Meloidogyne incognita TaxID=6306 RepID=A0A914MNF5_MELIC
VNQVHQFIGMLNLRQDGRFIIHSDFASRRRKGLKDVHLVLLFRWHESGNEVGPFIHQCLGPSSSFSELNSICL